MAWLALGGLALVLLLLLMRGFANARVETIRKVAVWSAAGVGAALVVALLFTGRGMQALWTLALFGPLLWRLFHGWRAAKTFGRGGTASPNGETTVETATLRMTLHHGSGRMTGQVRRGALAGTELADLDLPRLIGLLDECRASDPESVPLLEAWLDRSHPTWREEAAKAQPPPGRDGTMTRAEALEVLGLSEEAGPEEVRAAHRRLMQAAHPDRGGSAWLAARLNAARDTLLRG